MNRRPKLNSAKFGIELSTILKDVFPRIDVSFSSKENTIYVENVAVLRELDQNVEQLLKKIKELE